METLSLADFLFLVGVPVGIFVLLWLIVGVILWRRPHLWDISKAAAQSPPLVEEAMLTISPKRQHQSAS